MWLAQPLEQGKEGRSEETGGEGEGWSTREICRREDSEQQHKRQNQPAVSGGRTSTGRSGGRAQTTRQSGRVAKASTHHEGSFER
eukprot:7186202-Pyramimonas_sp.AAC.2